MPNMPTTEIQEKIFEIVNKYVKNDDNGAYIAGVPQDLKKDMQELVSQVYTLGHRAAIEEVEKKIEDKCPKKFAIHDDEEGKRIQADYETGFKDAKKSIMYSISSLKESDNGSTQKK